MGNPSAQTRWDHRRWGTLEDPVHKSQLSSLVGEFACTKQFQFDRLREARGEERTVISGSSAMGTAGHETIARALRRAADGTPIRALTEAAIRHVLLEEFARATVGLEVIWYGASGFEKALRERVLMLAGLFRDFDQHVAAVELVEAGFISQVGDIWTEGHVDLVYRPRENPDALALTDWKTGAQRPHPLVLEHGYESGFYSAALERGLFLPREVLGEWRGAAQENPTEALPWFDLVDVEALIKARSEREAMHVALRALARIDEAGVELPDGVVTFDRFPETIRLTFLPDYVPYQKAGKKRVDRPEELAFWGLEAPGEVRYEAGQQRGPAWYHVRRSESDLPRLERLLRAVVGWVRMGKFVESVGEKCTRCPYRGPCLTSGYELAGDAAKGLNAALRGLDLAGADALSTDD